MSRSLRLFALGLALGLYCGQALAAPNVGEPAPKLVVPLVGGGRFDLGALRGSLVLVNFWATWCSPCREEMPALNSIYEKFHSRGVEVIGVSLDKKRERDDVVKAARSIHYPVALRGDTEEDGFGGTSELPITYLVDRSGTVRAILKPSDGALSEEAFERAMAPFLSNGSAGP